MRVATKRLHDSIFDEFWIPESEVPSTTISLELEKAVSEKIDGRFTASP